MTTVERSERMRRVRPTNTKPELALRRLIFALGFRYRLHGRGLPGRPDLVFAGRKKVIFMHGCFWHRHDDCKLARLPKSRVEFWTNKLSANKERDARILQELSDLGWTSLVVWECELRDTALLEKRVIEFLNTTEKQ